jgi:hypothetical protein
MFGARDYGTGGGALAGGSECGERRSEIAGAGTGL